MLINRLRFSNKGLLEVSFIAAIKAPLSLAVLLAVNENGFSDCCALTGITMRREEEERMVDRRTEHMNKVALLISYYY